MIIGLLTLVAMGALFPLVGPVLHSPATAPGGGTKGLPSGRRQKTVAIEMVKAADVPENVVRFVASTSQVDRDGDIIIPEGILTEHFDANPRFLYMHDGLHLPAGRVVNHFVDDRGFIIDVEFIRTDDYPNPSEDVKRALDMAKMYETGFMSAVSIGFGVISGMVERREEGGYIFRQIDLFEVSGVTIPSNPGATMVQRSGESVELVRKWARDVLGDDETEVNQDPIFIGMKAGASAADIEAFANAVEKHTGRKVLAAKGLDAVWGIKDGRVLSAANKSRCKTIATSALTMLENAGADVVSFIESEGWGGESVKESGKAKGIVKSDCDCWSDDMPFHCEHTIGDVEYYEPVMVPAKEWAKHLACPHCNPEDGDEEENAEQAEESDSTESDAEIYELSFESEGEEDDGAGDEPVFVVEL